MNIRLIIFFLLAISTSFITYAAEYQHGHQALEIFDAEGMENTPTGAMIWMVVSVVWFTAGLIFVRQHSIARWVVGGFVAGFLSLILTSLISDRVVFQLAGYLSLSHLIFWAPAFYLLLKERPFLSRPTTFYSFWSGGMFVSMIISFWFDIPYAITFIRHVI